MTTYYPLEKLRKIPGFEFAKFADPYAGGVGNSIRYLAVSPRTNDMRVRGLDNLFVAGEKSGLFVGHTEAMATGALAGYNAVRYGIGMPLLTLPISTAVGDIISYENYRISTTDGRKNRYTFSGAEYFSRMKSLGFYTLDDEEIKRRIEKNNLTDIFKIKLI